MMLLREARHGEEIFYRSVTRHLAAGRHGVPSPAGGSETGLQPRGHCARGAVAQVRNRVDVPCKAAPRPHLFPRFLQGHHGIQVDDIRFDVRKHSQQGVMFPQM